ncbi:uncharacterized protein LOC130895745 [Diorhabda carinulata]|uniref:uncharacterized protein LOC130895745 n=1 Tax=Diorhabda carinulata TaxID=1163345 RepID=UPI0025A22577|nr:uncharacterized protein LOC130895745 [Diorhabda carinulata]
MIFSTRFDEEFLNLEKYMSLNINYKEYFDSEILSPCNCEENADMGSVPQAAFAAKKMRQREEQIQAMLDPAQYNSKFMNSIWGQYNRYSVHNLKKLIDDNIPRYFVNPVEKVSMEKRIFSSEISTTINI